MPISPVDSLSRLISPWLAWVLSSSSPLFPTLLFLYSLLPLLFFNENCHVFFFSLNIQPGCHMCWIFSWNHEQYRDHGSQYTKTLFCVPVICPEASYASVILRLKLLIKQDLAARKPYEQRNSGMAIPNDILGHIGPHRSFSNSFPRSY